MSDVTNPLVTVCIPTYNYAGFLGQAVESVLAQSFADFEVVVIDDASTDDTAAVMQTYLSDKRVQFVEREQNIGLFANFNSFIERSHCEYIKYLCADDWLHEDFLRDTVDLLEANETLGFACTANWRVDEAGRTTGAEYATFAGQAVVAASTAVAELANHLNVIGMPSGVLARREVLQQVGGFDAAFAPAADVHLWLKLLQTGGLGYVSEPRCFVRIHDSHTHSYGPDPTESVFLVWEDAATWPDSTVTNAVLADAKCREAERSLMYVVAHLLAMRWSRARAIVQFTRRHVSWPKVLPRLLLRLPAIAKDQVVRIYAIRRGRLVICRPRPSVGPRRDSVE
ncbi:MAG: glycosyltransferase family 2 protein [Thermoleophilaceae bacterium]|nr:glycosyltransferase family 2 protein [Thermoleophilaceae bacterium]